METINEQIKLTREKMGVSQTEMAAALGVSQQVFGNIETGRTKKISAEIYNNFLQLNKIGTNGIVKFENKDETIAALNVKIKIIMLEVMQLRSRVTGESIASIQFEYERLIKLSTE